MKADLLARYIINRAIKKDLPVTNIMLQRIMYLVDVYCVKATDRRLIKDSFFKPMGFGPVIEHIYNNHIGNKANVITTSYEYSDADFQELKDFVSEIGYDNFREIKILIDGFIDVSRIYLNDYIDQMDVWQEKLEAGIHVIGLPELREEVVLLAAREN